MRQDWIIKKPLLRGFYFGLITTNNLEQAQERTGGRLGNKGDECAVTALHMVAQFPK